MKKLLIFIFVLCISSMLYAAQTTYNIESDTKRTIFNGIIANDTELYSIKADKTNVLEKTNTTAYIPTTDYNPATKKYVDDGLAAKQDVNENLTDLVNGAISPTLVSQDSTHRFTTDTEKSTWNAKQNALGFTPVPNTLTINNYSLTGNLSLTKSDVGLGNVDNTTDLNKPISTLTQSALDLKATTTAIAINNGIGLNNGSTYTNYGSLTDDTLNELFSAIDSSFGTLFGNSHVAVTIGTANGLSLSTQAISLDLVDTDSSGAMSFSDYNFLRSIDTESELKSLYNLEIGTDIQAYNSYLSQLSGLTPLANSFIGWNSEGNSLENKTTIDNAKYLTPDKSVGEPGLSFMYEANSTDTNGNGWIGPTNATKNIFLKLEDETASVGQTLVVSNIAIDQTINTPIGNITADIWTLITGESSAAVSDDLYSPAWDGVTTIGASKNALYDKISALETQVTDMIAAFSAAGLNSFSFDPVTTFPLYSNTATPSIFTQ